VSNTGWPQAARGLGEVMRRPLALAACVALLSASIALCAAAALILGIPTSLGASVGTKTKVVCLTDWPSVEPQYRSKPRHCIFHKRNSPEAEAWFVRTRRNHWKFWRSGLAKAKGTAVVGMVGATPVRIKLSHPVEQCGHRVFSKARFRFPEFGTGSGMRLETCA
jgi:hypothetical protein